MKKRIRELVEALSGDTSKVGDSEYRHMWDELEELEAVTGNQLRRRGSRSCKNPAMVNLQPSTRSVPQVIAPADSLDQERARRVQAESDCQWPPRTAHWRPADPSSS